MLVEVPPEESPALNLGLRREALHHANSKHPLHELGRLESRSKRFRGRGAGPSLQNHNQQIEYQEKVLVQHDGESGGEGSKTGGARGEMGNGPPDG